VGGIGGKQKGSKESGVAHWKWRHRAGSGGQLTSDGITPHKLILKWRHITPHAKLYSRGQMLYTKLILLTSKPNLA